ncbi:hypothetical protein FGO68_gene17549 [Halteria grandinella]|uniref:Uncharacterized protein n=1 Tax=Halteria grandinella TaxID=5974 RepID=A0A8J8NGM3_HALGN|nr:hypothetical protein FGO68_gene17549 [Halteria grandinella]
MKGKAEFFKDVRRQILHQNSNHYGSSFIPTINSQSSESPNNRAGNTTINIGNVVIQNFSRQQSTLNNTTTNGKESAQVQAQQIIMGEMEQQIMALQKQLKEFNRLRESEKKAHQSILQLQDLIRKQRVLSHFKEVLLRQKYEHELDNLRAQLNNNTQLWQQLAESQKREQIIKGDLEGVQQHIITQEKIIEQLKDELRLEKIEKTKLMQYKVTKSRRLEDLEGKAREFEVMSNLNLPKMISMLESKDSQIDQMRTNMKLNEAHINSTLKHRDIEVQSYRKRIDIESKIKGEALVKLENLRHELQLIEGGTDIGIADVWKDKCRKLVDICKSFKEENDRLQLLQSISHGNPSVHSSANHDAMSEGTNSIIEQSATPGEQRFKKKKIDLMSQQQKQLKDAALLQNQSFAAAPHQHSVLAGNFSANYSHSLERVQSNLIKLPKLQYKSRAAPGQPMVQGDTSNIFHLNSNFQPEQVAPIAETVETVKTPLRTIYDQDSHISSIQQNLDPMYDAAQSRIAMQQVKNEEAKNVFSSLKEDPKGANLSMQTSGTVLAEFNQNYSSMPSQYLQQVPGLSIPPGFISHHPQVFDNPSFAQTQFSRNNQQPNVFMADHALTAVAGITGGNQGTNMFSTQNNTASKDDRGKYKSAERGSFKPRINRGLIPGSGANAKHIDIANLVRAKLMSPPRALQRDVEYSGFKGYNVLKKKDQE